MAFYISGLMAIVTQRLKNDGKSRTLISYLLRKDTLLTAERKNYKNKIFRQTIIEKRHTLHPLGYKYVFKCIFYTRTGIIYINYIDIIPVKV